MKKKIVIACLAVILLAAILFVPIPIGPARDGGTRVYSALTYKIVVWNKIVNEQNEDGQPMKYHNISVFWYPDNQKSIDELWQMELAGK